MARPRTTNKKSAPAKDRRPAKKKTSILNSENIEWIDYKDVNLLRRFMSERAKIRARRVTGNDQQQQVAVARAIKLAREMALLPYSVRQVTQRSTTGVQKQADAMRRNRAARDARDREGAQATAAQLEGRTIEVLARAGEGGRLFGSVTAADIAEAVLTQTGIDVDRRKIALD